jgi:hypothetical protein
VTQQLKRAQALLQEHKTSKQLARLVSHFFRMLSS